MELAIIENLQREDLSALEAESYKQLMNTAGLTQDGLSQHLVNRIVYC